MIFFETLLFTATVTAPLLLWIALGYGMRRVGILSTAWVQRGSWSMFYVFLPILMFVSMVRKPLEQALDPVLLAICFVTTYVIYLGARYLSARRGLGWADASVYQQGALRGNLGIIGVSLCLNAYGQQALLDISLLMAVLAVFYNILSTLIFFRKSPPTAGKNNRHWLLSLLFNPLIAASLAGLVVNLSPLDVPVIWLDAVLNGIQYSFPVALVCVGGSLSVRGAIQSLGLTRDIALMKLVIMPLIAVCLMLAMGYQGATLGMVFLLTASPVATASFVMARGYGANSEFAANVVVITTVVGLLTLSLGVFLLRLFDLM